MQNQHEHGSYAPNSTTRSAASRTRLAARPGKTTWRSFVVAVPLVVSLVLAGCAVSTDADTLARAVSASSSASPSAEPSPSPTATAVSASPEPTPSPRPSETASAASGTAEAAALALVVKGKSAKTGYERDQFGSGWVDVDRNGCDTRNDMLNLRLENREMSGNCKVLAGDLPDPFTGTWIHFEQGGASEVDVDHLVALSDAWQKGASGWEFAQRVAFANDPLNLEPVQASANRQKGDGDAATWLPSYKPFRCEYVARQVAVKAKYDVWVTQSELDAILGVLATCPEQALPDAGDQPVIADNIGQAPEPEPEPEPKKTATEKPAAPKPEPEAALDKRYPYCKDLPSGFGPYVEGKNPEYDWYTDRDGDGVVCE
ncbi:GmrSD restriction endonuclease domain-containing protein [Demequina aurantiaca]|uniref:GmrSD restriction endonuclease domain-containing protein n=1 Tax=Demequina aurantiaca TaxID=676200 RepID=UPI003D332E52